MCRKSECLFLFLWRRLLTAHSSCSRINLPQFGAMSNVNEENDQLKSLLPPDFWCPLIDNSHTILLANVTAAASNFVIG
jgi:hypothetical protein